MYIQLGELEGARAAKKKYGREGELVFVPLPAVRRRSSIRVRRVSILAPFAAAFSELPTRLEEENAEMKREEGGESERRDREEEEGGSSHID